MADSRPNSANLIRLILGVSICAVVGLWSPPAGAQKFTSPTGFNAQLAGTAPEGMIAVGGNAAPNNLVLVMTHHSDEGICFYSKNGVRQPADFSTVSGLFGTTPDSFPADLLNGSGDPVVHYDATPGNGRFIILTMGDGHNFWLAISKANADPKIAANWWKYIVNSGSHDIDYPGLGLSSDKLAITSGTAGDHTLFVLNRATAYSGSYPQFPQVVTLTEGSQAIPLPSMFKACRNLSADATLHLVGLSATDLIYRTVTETPEAPILHEAHFIPIGSTTSPVPGDQRGAALVTDCQPQQLITSSYIPDIYMRNGTIAVAWSSGIAGHSAIRCVRFSTTAPENPPLDDFVQASNGRDYAYPSVTIDKQGAVLLGYDRFSAEEYPSVAMIARRGGVTSPEYVPKVSPGPYEKCRGGYGCSAAVWGDYTSMTIDESEPATTTTQTTAYYLGQWASTTTTGSTFVGRLNANYGNCSVSGVVQRDINGVREPQPGAPVVLVQNGVIVASTTTVTNGSFSFGLVPTGTYTLRMNWDPTIGLEAIAGTGAYMISDISTTEIYMQLKSGNQCVGNTFVINAVAPATVTAVSPTSIAQNGTATLTVTGDGFSSYSRICFDGRQKAGTTYDPNTHQLQVTLSGTGDFSRHGVHSVSVFNPGQCCGGISNEAPVLVLAPYFTALSLVSNVTACPGGDAGHITASVTVQSHGSPCPFDLASATANLILIQVSGSGFHIWDASAVQVNPDPYPAFSVTGTPAGGGQFNFDVSSITGCGTLIAGIQITSSLGSHIEYLSAMPIDLKSYDLNADGVTNASDLAAMAALLGTGPGCGDFNRDDSTDQLDVNDLNAHLGHSHPAKATYPDSPGALPKAVELAAAHPNPATNSASIDFALPKTATVRIGVFDVAGRLVRVLTDGRIEAGYHTATWDLRNGDGSRAASGVYFYRMTVGSWVKVKKLLVTH